MSSPKTRGQIKSEYEKFSTTDLSAECQSLKREIAILRNGVRDAEYHGKYKRRDNLRTKIDKAKIRHDIAKRVLKSRQLELF